MDGPNLTVLCHALVTRLVMSGKQASGVEIVHDGKVQPIAAGVEVVLSLGAFHTPKVLMLSGIGDQTELQWLGIPCVQHLPAGGQNLPAHLHLRLLWNYPPAPPPPHNHPQPPSFIQPTP